MPKNPMETYPMLLLCNVFFYSPKLTNTLN